jgi:hypothetical protein
MCNIGILVVGVGVSPDTIQTALLGIAKGGDDSILWLMAYRSCGLTINYSLIGGIGYKVRGR